jgi:RNA polymerase sigma factor (sigma-70 family)
MKDGRDFRVTVTVRNGRLMRAIEAHGFDTLIEFARMAKIEPSMLSAFVTLKKSPFRAGGGLREPAERMALYLNKEIEELFPPAFLHRALAKSSITLELDAHQVVGMLAQPQSPEAAMITDQALSQLDASLAKLTPRQRTVIEQRFGLDGKGERTLDQVAAANNLHRERVRQIEKRALEAMQHADKKSRALRAAARDLRELHSA